MQLLFDRSDEFGEHQGLGLIPGVVTAIPNTTSDRRRHKTPHVGWNKLLPASDFTAWNGTILDGLPRPIYCYFLHSFAAYPENEEHRLCDCLYGGRRIAAAVRRGSIWGCQFHPEKSGPQGLRMIANFLGS